MKSASSVNTQQCGPRIKEVALPKHHKLPASLQLASSNEMGQAAFPHHTLSRTNSVADPLDNALPAMASVLASAPSPAKRLGEQKWSQVNLTEVFAPQWSLPSKMIAARWGQVAKIP